VDYALLEPAPIGDRISEIGDRMIIVGGSPRSGTTITQAVLDSHPKIFGGPEFDRLPDIAKTRGQLLDSLAAGRIVDFCDRDAINASFGRLIESLLYPAMQRHGASYISEKTPSNVLEFEALLEMLPGAKFVEVVRDPRAVVNSMLSVAGRHRQKGLEPPDSIATLHDAIQTLVKHINAGFAAYQKHPDRVFRLKYEDLVLSPEATTRKLFDYLGIEWDSRVLSPGKATHAALDQARVADGGLWDAAGGFFDLFDTSLNAWEDRLGEHPKALVTQVFRASRAYRELDYAF
jgi:hypothetical protein